jgi:hypothetical protein
MTASDWSAVFERRLGRRNLFLGEVRKRGIAPLRVP